jgi:hypothetical protein
LTFSGLNRYDSPIFRDEDHANSGESTAIRYVGDRSCPGTSVVVVIARPFI